MVALAGMLAACTGRRSTSASSSPPPQPIAVGIRTGPQLYAMMTAHAKVDPTNANLLSIYQSLQFALPTSTAVSQITPAATTAILQLGFAVGQQLVAQEIASPSTAVYTVGIDFTNIAAFDGTAQAKIANAIAARDGVTLTSSALAILLQTMQSAMDLDLAAGITDAKTVLSDAISSCFAVYYARLSKTSL
jgi:hypothetical protein